jgi:hypothetical protein
MHKFFKQRIRILSAILIACSSLVLGIVIGFGSSQHIAQQQLDFKADESIKKLSSLCDEIIKTDAEYNACLDQSVFLKISSYCVSQPEYKACLEEYKKKGWGSLIERESKTLKKPNIF